MVGKNQQSTVILLRFFKNIVFNGADFYPPFLFLYQNRVIFAFIKTKSMGVLFLALTIIAESAAVIFMKLSNGFQHKGYGFAAVITYLLSFVFLTLALKTLNVGIANAIWAGASTVVVAILGIYIFKEQLTGWQIIFLLLVVVGLVGLNLTKPA